MISSPGCCRPLNGLLAVIGIDFLPYQDARRKSSQGNRYYIIGEPTTAKHGIARSTAAGHPIIVSSILIL